MSSDPPELAVVIPTWNGWALLQECLDSLRAQTFQDMEIIVVDDGSTDDTPARLAVEFPTVHCIVYPVNRGFAAAANEGLAAARSPWMFLLNNDVTLEAQCVEKLMNVAREGKYQMICPLVRWTDEPERIYSAGDAMSPGGRPSSLGFNASAGGFGPSTHPFGVSGGYGLFKKSLLDNTGLLDEAFVAYFEDADLCFRARWAGHSATIVPDAEAHHVGSASIQGRSWWRTRQCFQNHALLVAKNFSLPLLWRNRGAIVHERCHQWRRVFQAARHEWGLTRAVVFTAGAWCGLLARLPGALVARRRVMARRVISDDAMQSLLESGTDKNGL